MTKENSHALPSYYYRDPSLVIESKQLHQLGCRACDSHHILLDRVVCSDTRKTNTNGIPKIGIKCKFFKEKANQC